MRKLEEAEIDLVRVAEIDGNEDSPYLWMRRVQLAIAHGDGSQAERLLDEILKRDATFDVIALRAQSAWLQGDLATAQEMLRQATRDANVGDRASLRRQMPQLFEEHPDLSGQEALREILGEA